MSDSEKLEAPQAPRPWSQLKPSGDGSHHGKETRSDPLHQGALRPQCGRGAWQGQHAGWRP
eukprot:13894389-Alexandrium_andersonii.AAC.1